ncbi:hypothetical protein JCM19992_20780 [Thermostilla marina]
MPTRTYSFGYWLHGWRKPPEDPHPDVLCIETGYFGLQLNVGDLRHIRFGCLADNLDYVQALNAGASRLTNLPVATLNLEIALGETTYRAVACRAARRHDMNRLEDVRLWESGRYVQRYDLLGLQFEDASRNALPCDAVLEVVAWPDRLVFNLAVKPSASSENTATNLDWSDAVMRAELESKDGNWAAERRITNPPDAKEVLSLSLACPVIPSPDELNVTLRVRSSERSWPVDFDPRIQARRVTISGLERDWKTGYTDIRNYDEFVISAENPGDETVFVPFLFYLRNPANITGLCPILCDVRGVPLGVPVQLSKNWHESSLGSYLRAYTMLPSPPGRADYLLRVVYGFYGELPSASHAQLSLVGWGKHGRWDQMAIGCWGETMCLDTDMSAVDVAITDVRMLMTRNGKNGKMWSWTDAGWGGDWLGVFDEADRKIAFSEMKAAYISHGPCLTDVRYHGYYGPQRIAEVRARVSTLRTDDYARTFHTLQYRFQKATASRAAWLFKMGRTHALVTPHIAYGNAAGLIEEADVPSGLKPGDVFRDHVTLAGDGPWWVAFPGAEYTNGRSWGTGYRALVVRSYHAVFGGKTYDRPTISFPVNRVQKDGRCDLDLLLVPPAEVGEFSPGDVVEASLEWITLPRNADDYYGPNETFRRHLAANPNSWKTTYREAIGNNLHVSVVGGQVAETYPIRIVVTDPEVTVTVRGGVGAVPITFEGLASPYGYTLFERLGERIVEVDQSIHGNDFWQTMSAPSGKRYARTYNLPLDGKPTSVWILRRDPPEGRTHTSSACSKSGGQDSARDESALPRRPKRRYDG